jgi:transposase-like protein
MERNLKEIIALVKELPERYLDEAFDKIKAVKEKADAEEEADRKNCPKRGSRERGRNGHECKKQAYVCRGCGKSFVQATGSALENSHGGEALWKRVIRDTVEGVSLDETAESLDLTHATVFNLRPKRLCRVEQEFKTNPTKPTGICETDERAGRSPRTITGSPGSTARWPPNAAFPTNISACAPVSRKTTGAFRRP